MHTVEHNYISPSSTLGIQLLVLVKPRGEASTNLSDVFLFTVGTD